MFTDVQYTFTRHVRDPEHNPAPADIPAERMAVYTDLIYNNMDRMIGNLYPVIRKITPDKRWHMMIRDFLKRHQAHASVFNRVAMEFLHYLEKVREVDDDPPWLRELAHYEWVDYASSVDPREIVWDGINTGGDLLQGIPVLNPLVWPLHYSYPVHRISPDFLPAEPPEQPTYLVVYRNRHDQVGFLELNPVSARLLQYLRENDSATGEELLRSIAEELQHPRPDVVINGGVEIMQNFRSKDILLGTRS